MTESGADSPRARRTVAGGHGATRVTAAALRAIAVAVLCAAQVGVTSVGGTSVGATSIGRTSVGRTSAGAAPIAVVSDEPAADEPVPDGPGAPPPAPPGAGVPAPGAGYAWPLLPAPAVLRLFEEPAHAYGPGHRGVDLAGAPGRPVLAARAGTVAFAGPVAGRYVVSVQHDDGLRTTYEPVTPLVTAGTVVRAGDVLGSLEPGHAGCPTVPACLHWGVRRDRTEYLDPLVLLRPPRVRLLPVPVPWPG